MRFPLRKTTAFAGNRVENPRNYPRSAQARLEQQDLLNYLDRVHEQIAALPYPEEVKQAAVRQEGLRRRPELLQGENQQAAARRGVLLLCAVVLGKVGAVGEQAVAAVRAVLSKATRASSAALAIKTFSSTSRGS